MPDNPTASTSTSIIVPSSPPHNAAKFNEWDVASIIISGVVALIVALGGVAAIVAVYFSWLDRRRTLERERGAPLENRVHLLEEANKKFRVSDQIDKDYNHLDEKLEHFKNNTLMKFEAVQSKLDHLERSDSEMSQSQIKLRTQMEGVEATIRRIEQGQDRLGDKVDERFDRLQEMMMQKV